MIRILSVRIITRKVRDADTITEKKVPAAIMERAETAAVIIVIENSSCIQTEYPVCRKSFFSPGPAAEVPQEDKVKKGFMLYCF